MKSIVVACCLVLGALGCADRTYMTPGFGQVNHATMARQTAHPQAGEQGTATAGLDTQEAAVISQSYRTSLAHRGPAVSQEAAVLHITPTGETGSDGVQPPSVPLESR